MELPRDAMLLRVFIGEADEWQGKSLYEQIVLQARERKLAGATVLRGPMGFGKSSHLHTTKILRLSMDLPIVIEIVDSEEKIREFLPILDEMITGGLVTLERVQAIVYRGAQKGEGRVPGFVRQLPMRVDLRKSSRSPTTPNLSRRRPGEGGSLRRGCSTG